MTATARELRGLLFTDIVGSTEHAARLRDRAWREVLERHDEMVAEQVRDFGGRIATKAGDGVFAIFATPGQAVRCGQAVCEAVRPLGIEVRAGVHFGECEPSPHGPVGLAVHVAQRISALAGPGEVLVSGTVADLLAGSDLELVERGMHELKGVPGEHRVFAAGEGAEAGGAVGATGAIRIVIGEDAYLIRESLRRLLASRPDVTVAAIREDLDGLLEAIETERPDVVLTDIRMPPEHSDEGIRLAQLLRERSPGTGVVVLSQHAEPRYAVRLLAEGSEGRGYLLKERVSDADQLVAAIKEVARGGSVIDPKLVDALVGAGTAGRSALDELTPREREVLAEMAQGKNNAAIAESLVLTERAVEKHVGSIFAKLGLKWEESVNRRVKAVLIYLSEGSS